MNSLITMSLGENTISSNSSSHLTVDNGSILMAVTKKGRVRGDSHCTVCFLSYSVDRVDVILEMEQWTKQAAMAGVACLACLSISCATSTL